MMEYDPAIHGSFQQYQDRQVREMAWFIHKRLAGSSNKAISVDDQTMALATDEAVVQTGRKAATFVVTTSQIDRDSDIVLPLGIRTEHWARAGAPWFFGHGSDKFPIGTSLDENGKLHFQADERAATATIFFDDDEFSQEVKRKVCVEGSMRACSIAFVPIDAESMGMKANQRMGQGSGGYLFRDVDLTEISVVPIPSNPDAVLISCSPIMKQCVSSYCKMFSTQGDTEGSGIPGRNANPDGDAEQEKEECDCPDCMEGKACGCSKEEGYDPVTDEIIERYGDETPDDLIERYREGGGGVDPNHYAGHGHNEKSATHLVALTSHAREEAKFVSLLDEQNQQALGADYVGKLQARLKDLEDRFSSEHPDLNLDDEVTKFETDFDNQDSTGEANLVGRGDIPPELPDEVMAGEDEAEDEMLEQVETKSWADQPADPAIIRRLEDVERILRQHTGGGQSKSGYTASQLFARDPDLTRGNLR
jgi:hypothetical protein